MESVIIAFVLFIEKSTGKPLRFNQGMKAPFLIGGAMGVVVLTCNRHSGKIAT